MSTRLLLRWPCFVAACPAYLIPVTWVLHVSFIALSEAGYKCVLDQRTFAVEMYEFLSNGAELCSHADPQANNSIKFNSLVEALC